MAQLVLFAKGNLDVRDTLHSLMAGKRLLWNGLNEIMRARFPGVTIRLRHETFTRSDALLEATGLIPAELESRALPLDAYPLKSQFSTAIFEAMPAAYILSLQPDITTSLLRHRLGALFYPNARESWTAEDRGWLREEFAETPVLTAAESMRNFERIVARIRGRSEAPILIYNLSAVIPGEWIHSFEGLGEIYSTRIRRFNLCLTELSERTGISVVDVDMIVARAGADRVKLDAVHLNAEGCRLVAEEVVRILEDLGVLTCEGLPA